MPDGPPWAPSTHSSAAPAYWSEPASTPTTPRTYLWVSLAGTGYASQTSARSNASSTGSSRYGSRPMSTRWTHPALRAAGGARSAGLYVPNVTVRSATTWGAGTPAPSTSTPLGTSTATTYTPDVRAAATCDRAGSRRPGRPPMPTTPSMSRSVASQSGSCVRRAPARTAAVRPSACTVSESSTTRSTFAPREASRAAAYRASPPLSPAPTRATTLLPYTRPRTSTHTAAIPMAARCISAPSGNVAINADSARRTDSTACACRIDTSLVETSPLQDYHGRGDTAVVRDRQMRARHPQHVRAREDGAPHRQTRLTGVLDVGLDVDPVHTGRRTERLGEGLLGREATGQRSGNELGLGGQEQPLEHGGRAAQRLGEALDLDHVDADPDDHLPASIPRAPVGPTFGHDTPGVSCPNVGPTGRAGVRTGRAVTRRSRTSRGCEAGRHRARADRPPRMRTPATEPSQRAAASASVRSAGGPGGRRRERHAGRRPRRARSYERREHESPEHC